jgi:hypothetical protein
MREGLPFFSFLLGGLGFITFLTISFPMVVGCIVLLGVLSLITGLGIGLYHDRDRKVTVLTQAGPKQIRRSYFLGDDGLENLYQEVMAPIPAPSVKPIASGQATDDLIKRIEAELNPRPKAEKKPHSHEDMNQYTLQGDDQILATRWEDGCEVEEKSEESDGHSHHGMAKHCKINHLGEKWGWYSDGCSLSAEILDEMPSAW